MDELDDGRCRNDALDDYANASHVDDGHFLHGRIVPPLVNVHVNCCCYDGAVAAW